MNNEMPKWQRQALLIFATMLGIAGAVLWYQSKAPNLEHVRKPAREIAPEKNGWRIFGMDGPNVAVYCPPEKFSDRGYIESVAKTIAQQHPAKMYIQVEFYDTDQIDLRRSSDAELFGHLKATYWENRVKGRGEFTWRSAK